MSSPLNSPETIEYLRNTLLARNSIATDDGDPTAVNAMDVDNPGPETAAKTMGQNSTKARAEATHEANAVIRKATLALNGFTDSSKDIIWALDHIDSDVARAFENKIKDVLGLFQHAERPLSKLQLPPIMWLPMELHIEILHMATEFNERTPVLGWCGASLAAGRTVWANFIKSQLRGVGELIEAAPRLETQILDVYFGSLHLDLTDAPYTRSGKIRRYDYDAMERRILAVASVPFLKNNVRHASWTWSRNLRGEHQRMCLDFLLDCPNLKTLKIFITDAELWRRAMVNGRTDRIRGRGARSRDMFGVVNAMTIAQFRGLDRLDFVLDFKFPTQRTAAQTQQFLATQIDEWSSSQWYTQYAEAMSAIARSPKEPAPPGPTKFRNYVGVLRSGLRVQEPLEEE